MYSNLSHKHRRINTLPSYLNPHNWPPNIIEDRKFAIESNKKVPIMISMKNIQFGLKFNQPDYIKPQVYGLNTITRETFEGCPHPYIDEIFKFDRKGYERTQTEPYNHYVQRPIKIPEAP